MKPKATRLEEALTVFEPSHPLRGAEELALWFRPRRSSPRDRLRILLETAKTQSPQKLLFVGHRGSGKSTELNKLAEELAASFETIVVDILETTGRTSPSFQDVILALTQRITRHCLDHQLTRPAILEPAKKWLAQLTDWWSRRVTGVDWSPAANEKDVSASLSHQLVDLELSIKQSSQRREDLQEFLAVHLPEQIAYLSWVLETAESRLEGRRILVLVEGLDKIDLAAAREIFHEHAPTIISPKAHMIMTFPLALRHSDEFNSIRLSFTGVYFLPNIATLHRDGAQDPEGLEHLRSLVEARLAEDCIAADALDLAVEQCGGSLVQLVALIRQAALFAMAAKRERIHRNDMGKAVDDLRAELMSPLKRSDYPILRERRSDHQLTSDEAEQRLIFNGALVEYANGNPWCDAHPTLWPLLEEQPPTVKDEHPVARRAKRS